MKKIVLLCSAGMSTSLLVTKMREYAESIGYECQINAYGVALASEEAEGADIVLLGPQVRFQRESIQKRFTCPVEIIEPTAYGTMNGKAVMEMVLKKIG